MTSQSVIFGCAGLSLSEDERRFYYDVQPWGFILFARNIDTADQVKALCAELRSTVGRDAPILIDQEGGRVARLRAPLAEEWPNPKDHILGLPLDRACDVMRLRYKMIADDILRLGIDVNCAPMLDVSQDDTNAIIADRAYGSDANTVSKIGRAAMDGLLSGGVLPVIKHIPGHGRATIDSHLDLPRVMVDLEDLRKVDFAPFAALRDAPMAMTAHVIYDAVDPERCATLSPSVIQLIREELEVDALLMTDDLSMKALQGRFQDRAANALEAGCDIILHCNGVIEEMTEVAKGLKPLANRALYRANAALAAKMPTKDLDREEARARLRYLLNTRNA
ncbi:MAG: glycoside hydrolase family 3 protein [Pseudomonadota bacterium]